MTNTWVSPSYHHNQRFIKGRTIYILSGETSPLLQSFLFALFFTVCVCVRGEAGSGGVKSRWSLIPILSIFS